MFARIKFNRLRLRTRFAWNLLAVDAWICVIERWCIIASNRCQKHSLIFEILVIHEIPHLFFIFGMEQWFSQDVNFIKPIHLTDDISIDSILKWWIHAGHLFFSQFQCFLIVWNAERIHLCHTIHNAWIIEIWLGVEDTKSGQF